METLADLYRDNPQLAHAVIGLFVFGGLARIAFWRNADGMRVGGPLVVGLALLLTVAIVVWADENRRCIQEFGPWAAFFVVEALLLLAFNARRKAKEA